MTKNTLNSKVTNATKWSAITTITRKLIVPITNMILARILVPSAFGIVATINMVITFADIFTDAGFQKYLVQHNFKSEKELEKYANVSFWTNIVLSVLLWFIIFIFRNSIAALVGSKGYGIHLSIAALVIPVLSFSSIQQAIYKRNFDFKSMFIPRLVNSVIPIIVTIPLALVLKNCWALIIGNLVASLSDAILLTIKSKWKPSIFYSFNILKAMFSFSAWTLLEQLSIWLTVNIDIFFIGNILNAHYLGLYKTSLTTVSQITSIITTTIIPVLFAALSRCQNDDNKFKQTFYDFQEKTGMLIIPLSVGIFVFSEFVTSVLLGKKWMTISMFIGMLGLFQCLIVIVSNFASEVYRAKGKPKVSLMVQIIYIIILCLGVNISANISFNILCIFRAVSLIIFTLINLIVLRVMFKFSIIKMFNSISHYLFASIIMGIVGLILSNLYVNTIYNFISVIICIIVYFSVLFLFPKERIFLSTNIKRIVSVFSKKMNRN